MYSAIFGLCIYWAHLNLRLEAHQLKSLLQKIQPLAASPAHQLQQIQAILHIQSRSRSYKAHVCQDSSPSRPESQAAKGCSRCLGLSLKWSQGIEVLSVDSHEPGSLIAPVSLPAVIVKGLLAPKAQFEFPKPTCTLPRAPQAFEQSLRL